MTMRKGKPSGGVLGESYGVVDEDIEGRRLYNIEDKLSPKVFNDTRSILKLASKDVSYEALQTSGFEQPILVKDSYGLGLQMPPSNFTVKDVQRLVEPERKVQVIDAMTQSTESWTMSEWVTYYTSPKLLRGTRIWNVISLEFSGTRMDAMVSAPTVVRELDWAQKAWPLDMIYMDLKSLRSEELTFPKVFKYCLMSVSGCYTDFHIDLGGTSVWYHIFRGRKIFWLIPPTEDNIQKFIEWSRSGEQEKTFLGDICTGCQRISLREGNTFFIPSGWIHAVYTPVESLVFGGNFLHSLNVGMQLRVLAIEDTLKVPLANRYPFFHEMQWYVYDHYNIALTGTSFMRMDGESVAEFCDIIDVQPVFSKHELAGLMNLREWLPNQDHDTFPDDSSNRQKLLDSMMVQLAQHKQDAAQGHSPRRRSVLQWKPYLLEQYKKKWTDALASELKVQKTSLKLPKIITLPKILTPEPKIVKRPRGRPRKRRLPRTRPFVVDDPGKVKEGESDDLPKPKEKVAEFSGKGVRRSSCQQCKGCQLKVNCGKCTACLDMPAFGGPGKSKQKCVRRKCVMLTNNAYKYLAGHDPKQVKLTQAWKNDDGLTQPRKRGRPSKVLPIVKLPIVKQVGTEQPVHSQSGSKRPAAAVHHSAVKKMKRNMPFEDEFGDGIHQTAEEFGYTEDHLNSLLNAADSSRLAINGGDIVIYRTEEKKLFVFVKNMKEGIEAQPEEVKASQEQDTNQFPGLIATKPSGSSGDKVINNKSAADRRGSADGDGSAGEAMDDLLSSEDQQDESGELGDITCVSNMLEFLKDTANQARQGKKNNQKLIFLCKSKTVNDGGMELKGQPVLVDNNSYLFANAMKSTCTQVKVLFGNVSISLPLVFPKSGDVAKCADLMDKPIAAKVGSTQPVASTSKCSSESAAKKSAASFKTQFPALQPSGRKQLTDKKSGSLLPVRVICASTTSSNQHAVYATPVQTLSGVVSTPVSVASTSANVMKPAVEEQPSISAMDATPILTNVCSPLQGSIVTVAESEMSPETIVKCEVENLFDESGSTPQILPAGEATTRRQNEPQSASDVDSHNEMAVGPLIDADDTTPSQTKELAQKVEESCKTEPKAPANVAHGSEQTVLVHTPPAEASDHYKRTQEIKSDDQVTTPELQSDDQVTTPELQSDDQVTTPELQSDDQVTTPELQSDDQVTTPELQSDDQVTTSELQSSTENGDSKNDVGAKCASESDVQEDGNIREKVKEPLAVQQCNQTSLKSPTVKSVAEEASVSTHHIEEEVASDMEDGEAGSSSQIIDRGMASDFDSEDMASELEADMMSELGGDLSSDFDEADMPSDFDEADMPSDFEEEYMEAYIKEDGKKFDVDDEIELDTSAQTDEDIMNEDIAHFGGDVKIIKMSSADIESHTSCSNSANESSNDCVADSTIVTKTLDDFFAVSSKKEKSVSPPDTTLADRRLRGKACGECEACCADDCRKCIFCKDMKKYGGRGRLKQKCKYKKCTAMNRMKRSELVSSPPVTPKVVRNPKETTGTVKSSVKTSVKAMLLPDLEHSPPEVDEDKTIKAGRKRVATSPFKEKAERPTVCDAKTYNEIMKKQASDVRKLQNCGECINCLDKKEFGGPGKKKQMCMEKKSELQRRVKNLTVEERSRQDSDDDYEFTPSKSLFGRSSSRRRKLTRKMEESLDQEWTDVVKAKMQSMSDYANNLLDNFLESLQDASDEEEGGADSEASDAADEDEDSAANEISYELLHDLIGDDPSSTPSAQLGASTSHVSSDVIVNSLQLGRTESGLTSLDLTKKVIDLKLVQEILDLQPEVITLNKAISTPKTLRSLLSGLSNCNEMSLKGVNAIIKTGLSDVPLSVVSLNLSANSDLSDHVFSSLFCKLNTDEALLGIQWLDVSYTAVGDNSVRQISKHLPLLQTLRMCACNNMTNSSLSFLADSLQLVILEEIEMTDCEGVDHECLQLVAAAKGFSKLKSLNFNGCPHISSTDIKAFIANNPSQPAWTHNRRHMVRDVP